MDDLPAEGDFDDLAAAVGEGGDGSDDDATVTHASGTAAYPREWLGFELEIHV